MNTNTRAGRVVEGSANETMLERRGDWALVELPSEVLALTYLPTGGRVATAELEDGDRVRLALRELGALGPLKYSKSMRAAVTDVLDRHGLAGVP